jgi:membrane protease YdiL (CAAX protease family)
LQERRQLFIRTHNETLSIVAMRVCNPQLQPALVGPWGWGHLLIAGFGGLTLTLLYVWRRNLWANIIAHFIVDAAVLGG